MFKLTKSGQVAGCFVTKGKINRAAQVAVLRNGEPVYEGKLGSLKRFKDDVRAFFGAGTSLQVSSRRSSAGW